MTVYLCNYNHPDDDRQERCVRNFGHDGAHAWIEGENLPAEERPGGVVMHIPSKGYPWLTITHEPHECAWCDAERWRLEDTKE